MIAVDKIKTQLAKVVGFKADAFTDTTLFIDQFESESGRFFQEAHPLITYANLNAIAPEFKNITFPPYEEGKLYEVGEKCTLDEINYVCKEKPARAVGRQGYIVFDPQEPPPSNHWNEFNPLAEWLEDKKQAAIQKVVTKITDGYKLNDTTKTFFLSKALFTKHDSVANEDTTKDAYVGFEIIPANKQNFVIKIEQIGLHLTNASIIDVYLYHTSCTTPISQVTIEATAGYGWYPVNFILQFFDTTQTRDAEHKWYLVYNINMLQNEAKPIVKDYDWSKKPCINCSDDFNALTEVSKYLEVYPITQYTEGEWNIDNNVYSPYNNHGLNLKLSGYCDQTDFIIANRLLFANAIMLQFAADMLTELLYNPNVRINRTTTLPQRADLIFALDGDTASYRKSGLKYDLAVAYEALTNNLKHIDNLCFPCKSKGIVYRNIG